MAPLSVGRIRMSQASKSNQPKNATRRTQACQIRLSMYVLSSSGAADEESDTTQTAYIQSCCKASKCKENEIATDVCHSTPSAGAYPCVHPRVSTSAWVHSKLTQELLFSGSWQSKRSLHASSVKVSMTNQTFNRVRCRTCRRRFRVGNRLVLVF